MQIRDRFYIGGNWRAPFTTETIDVHDAGTVQVMGRVPAGGEDDMAAAVAAAPAVNFASYAEIAHKSRCEEEVGNFASQS